MSEPLSPCHTSSILGDSGCGCHPCGAVSAEMRRGWGFIPVAVMLGARVVGKGGCQWMWLKASEETESLVCRGFFSAGKYQNELSFLSVTYSAASLETALVPEGNLRETQTLTGLNTAGCDGLHLRKAAITPCCMHSLLSQRQGF